LGGKERIKNLCQTRSASIIGRYNKRGKKYGRVIDWCGKRGVKRSAIRLMGGGMAKKFLGFLPLYGGRFVRKGEKKRE